MGPTASGEDFIPLLLSEMVALIIIGVIVKTWGYYVWTGCEFCDCSHCSHVQVPYMLLGEAICIAGTALLTQLHPTTPTVTWAAYLITAGIGMGIVMQLPYTAVQVTLL